MCFNNIQHLFEDVRGENSPKVKGFIARTSNNPLGVAQGGFITYDEAQAKFSELYKVAPNIMYGVECRYVGKKHRIAIVEMRKDGEFYVYCGDGVEKNTPRVFKNLNDAVACYDRVFGENVSANMNDWDLHFDFVA